MGVSSVTSVLHSVIGRNRSIQNEGFCKFSFIITFSLFCEIRQLLVHKLSFCSVYAFVYNINSLIRKNRIGSKHINSFCIVKILNKRTPVSFITVLQ